MTGIKLVNKSIIAKDKFTNYLGSEEGQSFLDKLKQFFISLIDAIKAIGFPNFHTA